ncbi:MAG: SpoIIE family protein phosphatase [Kiritimatiellia bacterium]
MNSTTDLDLKTFGAREILQLLPDGAYICDRDRRIVFWNDAAARITGWTADQVVGKHCRDNILVHIDKDGHPLCGKEFCPLYRCMVTRSRSSLPLVVFALHHDGYRVPVEVTVAPLVDATGEVLGGIEIFRDLTDTIRDLEHASQIQRELLKLDLLDDTRVKVTARFSPASLVGGDFYKAERLDDHLYALMVADVTGHGVSAALHCMQLCALWEEDRDLLTQPAALFTSMSRRLAVLTGHQDCFATALFVLLDARDGKLTWANAGHPEGLILTDSPPVRLETTGPALGLIPDFVFEQNTAVLPRGAPRSLLGRRRRDFQRTGVELGIEGLLRLAVKARRRAPALILPSWRIPSSRPPVPSGWPTTTRYCPCSASEPPRRRGGCGCRREEFPRLCGRGRA